MSRCLFAYSFAAALAGSLALRADDWPQWRGPDRTGVSNITPLRDLATPSPAGKMSSWMPGS